MDNKVDEAMRNAELAIIAILADLDDAESMLDAAKHICGADHPVTVALQDAIKLEDSEG